MPGTLDWGNSESVAILLANKYSDIDPVGAGLAELRDWIAGLEQLSGNTDGPNEAQLEDIRMAWHDEYNTRHWDAGPNPNMF